MSIIKALALSTYLLYNKRRKFCEGQDIMNTKSENTNQLSGENSVNEETLDNTYDDAAAANPSAFWCGLAFVVFALAFMTVLCKLGTKR